MRERVCVLLSGRSLHSNAASHTHTHFPLEFLTMTAWPVFLGYFTLLIYLNACQEGAGLSVRVTNHREPEQVEGWGFEKKWAIQEQSRGREDGMHLPIN